MLFKPTPTQIALMNKAAAAKDADTMSTMLAISISMEELPTAYYIIHHHFDCLTPEIQSIIERAGIREEAATACSVGDLLADIEMKIDQLFGQAQQSEIPTVLRRINISPAVTIMQ